MKIELEYIIEEPDITIPSSIPDLNIPYLDINNLYLNSFIDKRYNNFLTGKSVVIIGPANYLENQNRGEWFDNNFDVIVRLNRSHPVTNIKDFGSRCDIWYHNMSQQPQQGGPILKEHLDGIKFISTHFPKHLSYFHNDIKKCENILQDSTTNFHFWSDLEQYITFQLLLQTRLNIGTGAILDLLNYDIKTLHISGITFFEGGYNSSYPTRDSDLISSYESQKISNHPDKDKVLNHAQKPQKQLLQLIIENHNIITLDEEVKTALYL